jgi:hypothetical protein
MIWTKVVAQAKRKPKMIRKSSILRGCLATLRDPNRRHIPTKDRAIMAAEVWMITGP